MIGVASQPLFCMVQSGSTTQRQMLLVDEAWIFSRQAILHDGHCFWNSYERNFQRFGEVTLIRLIVLQRNEYSEAGKDSEVLIAV